MRLCQLDVLRALSSEKDDSVLIASRKLLLTKHESLFTKKGTLKKAIGKAHKGWDLKGTTNYARLLKLCDPGATDLRVTLEFHRRMLRSSQVRQLVRQFVNEFVNSSMSSSIVRPWGDGSSMIDKLLVVD